MSHKTGYHKEIEVCNVYVYHSYGDKISNRNNLKLDQTVFTALIKDEQVQYHWNVVSEHWESEAEPFLSMIAQLWITM